MTAADLSFHVILVCGLSGGEPGDPRLVLDHFCVDKGKGYLFHRPMPGSRVGFGPFSDLGIASYRAFPCCFCMLDGAKVPLPPYLCVGGSTGHSEDPVE